MQDGTSVEVRYFRVSEHLQPFFTALYLFDFEAPHDTRIRDCLYPEWTALRFAPNASFRAAMGRDPLAPAWDFTCTGPTSRVMHFDATTSCAWGLGLQPAGWARYIDPPASQFANRLFDASTEPSFAAFGPLLAIAADPDLPANCKAERMNTHLESLLPGRSAGRVEQVIAVHQALRDPAIANVSEIAERVGVGTRTLERICARWFGFPAKQELRRQRFLRSMARFMLADFRSWSDALDEHYYDQAQFVRDFRAFMQMTPSEYAEMPHPVLHRILAQRLVDQGVMSMGDLARLKDAVVQPAGRARN